MNIYFFFYCTCVMFAVRGDPVLRVQDIETVVTLGHNGLTVWRVHVTQMSHL